ncbi:MAG: NAD-dependent deacylase [Candidatus Promineifilaceae bacterium]
MSVESQIKRATALLAQSKHAVALTGAGISTPSGIPDFRSPGSGLWEKADPFQVASIYGFSRRPQDFYEWIHPLAKLTVAARPNAGHLALAQLEKNGPLKGVITQNIDTLHSKAGSDIVYEVHGHMRQMTCMRCYHVFDSAPFMEAFLETCAIPYCPHCGGILKPNVILFGEQLPVRILESAKKQTRLCDVMIVAGSSLEVSPVGDLPVEALGNGARLIIVNFEKTYADQYADVVIHADLVEVLPQLAAAFG